MSPAVGAGSRLGPYEILSPLGAGGMEEVYRRLHLLGDLPLASSNDDASYCRGFAFGGRIGHQVAARPDADSIAALVSSLRSGSRIESRFARLVTAGIRRRSLQPGVCLWWSGRETWSRREPQ
jgi:hypothetical protein